MNFGWCMGRMLDGSRWREMLVSGLCCAAGSCWSDLSQGTECGQRDMAEVEEMIALIEERWG